jgi:integrase
MPSEASIKQYKSRIALLNKAGFHDFTTQSADVIKYLDAMNTVSNRKLYTSAILYMYNYAMVEPPAVYNEYMGKQFAAQSVKDDKQELSPKQMEEYLTWDEIIAVREKLAAMTKNETQWRDYLVVCLYTMINPVRSDFGDMRVVATDNGTGNEVVLSDVDGPPHFTFRQYKTAKTYGEVRIPIPDDLYAVLEAWFAFLGEYPKFLLGVEYSGSVLSNYIRACFKKYTGKSTGINLLRHAFITHELSSPKSILEKRMIADSMLHSTHRQERYVVANGTETTRNDT